MAPFDVTIDAAEIALAGFRAAVEVRTNPQALSAITAEAERIKALRRVR